MILNNSGIRKCSLKGFQSGFRRGHSCITDLMCFLCVLRVSLVVGQPDLLAGGQCRRSGGGQLSRALPWLHGPRRRWVEPGRWPLACGVTFDLLSYAAHRVSVELRELSFFFCAEMPTVSRNCTEYGWSEPNPHYVDVCFFYDNTTKPVRPLSPHRNILLHLSHTQTHTDTQSKPLCVTPGHVLRVGQGSVHSRLQHIVGVPDHSHGDPLQIQVSIIIACFHFSIFVHFLNHLNFQAEILLFVYFVCLVSVYLYFCVSLD